MAQMFDAQQEALTQSVADAEAQDSLWRRSGLQSVRRSEEPRPLLCVAVDGQSGRDHERQKADGTRKVVWQTKARDSFFQMYRFVYWELLARMQQTLERARAAAQAQGSSVTPKTGLQTREMQAWRVLGRAMTDISIFVFL